MQAGISRPTGSLHRCLERHRSKAKRSTFADNAIGYMHIDTAKVQAELAQLYLFAANDGTSELTFVRLQHEAA